MCFFPQKKKRVVFQKSKNPSKSSNISGQGPQPPRPPFKRPWCSNLNFRKSRAAPLCSRFSSASPKKMAAGSTGSEKPWTSASPSSFYPGLWRGLFQCSLSWVFSSLQFHMWVLIIDTSKFMWVIKPPTSWWNLPDALLDFLSAMDAEKSWCAGQSYPVCSMLVCII